MILLARCLVVAVFFTLGITFVVILGWFKPFEVPDRFAGEPSPRKITKRDFVLGTAILALFCIGAPALHHLRSRAKKSVARGPVQIRWRRGKPITRPSQPPPGVAKKSKV